MRNHWIKLYNEKNNAFWTVEFVNTNKNKIVLKHRRIKIEDPISSLGIVGVNAREITICFSNGMLNSNDNELVDFILNSQTNMSLFKCTFNFYKNMSAVYRTCILSDLRYESVTTGNYSDMDFTFSYYTFKEYFYS